MKITQYLLFGTFKMVLIILSAPLMLLAVLIGLTMMIGGYKGSNFPTDIFTKLIMWELK